MTTNALHNEIDGPITQAIGRYILDTEFDIPAAHISHIVSAVEFSRTEGYCETCQYDVTGIQVTYVNAVGEEIEEEARFVSFSEILRHLIRTLGE